MNTAIAEETRQYMPLPEFHKLGPDFIKPVTVSYKPGYKPAPYMSVTFAVKYEDQEEPVSLFKSDKDKPWAETRACKILSETGLPIYGAQRMSVDRETGESREAIMYSYAMYDPTHPLFKPTVMLPVEYAMNLMAEVTIEVVLSFEGLILPCYKKVTTEGSYAMSLASMYHDIIREIEDEPEEFLDEIAGEDRSVRKCHEAEDGFDGYSLHLTSREGNDGDIDLGEDELRELYRHIVSFRVIEHKETIQNIIHGADFISVWDDGYATIKTKCSVNMDTKEVFDIQVNDDADDIEGLDNLDGEFICLPGSDERIEVHRRDEVEDDYDGFWYN